MMHVAGQLIPNRNVFSWRWAFELCAAADVRSQTEMADCCTPADRQQRSSLSSPKVLCVRRVWYMEYVIMGNTSMADVWIAKH